MARKTRRINILTRGSEVCPICHQRYLRELEYRCFDCDAPVCPTCVIIEKSNHSCPACAAHGGD